MAVLVVGASGFIGTIVSQRLSKRGIESIGYDLIQTDSGDQKTCVRGDVLDMQSIERVFLDYSIDATVHLVGLPAIAQCQKDPQLSFLLNVMSVQNTVEAMRKADIPRIIFASSATVYGDHDDQAKKETDAPQPTTVYGWHKLAAEKVIQSYSEAYGIKSVILRLFNVYGGDPKRGKEVVSIFINRGLKHEPFIVKGPGKFRDFVHIEDVADSFVVSLGSNHSDSLTINIGTGTQTTLKQLALMVGHFFPRSKVLTESTQDDGTGLWGNVHLAGETIGFSPRQPGVGIPDHVKKYAEQTVPEGG